MLYMLHLKSQIIEALKCFSICKTECVEGGEIFQSPWIGLKDFETLKVLTSLFSKQ